ncbi:MAG: hypothetical protein GY759_19510 [Chloroflexi bacterium]|nr:hypothetical protein [Chloroflexota bacterium]
MITKDFDFPKIDKTAVTIVTSFAEDDDKVYWQSCTPGQRLRHLEVLRRINYGYHATVRLQRVLEVSQRAGS